MTANGDRLILSRDQHPISRRQISDNALKVLYRLNKAGYEAYLVGGGVRDLLLGRAPKDFDVATNATPEQIRKLFSNCRLVGRRFRLAHVVFGRDVIEVATFRGHHHKVNTSKHISSQSDEGMLLRDNVYGTIEEDAERRDFTVNALYYSIKDFSLHDFHGGLQDLEDGVLELIGDPETRYREDPVRMLRAIRFAAKLGLDLSERTAAPIRTLAPLLQDIPPARLFEESIKLFLPEMRARPLLCCRSTISLLLSSRRSMPCSPRREIPLSSVSSSRRSPIPMSGLPLICRSPPPSSTLPCYGVWWRSGFVNWPAKAACRHRIP